MAKTHDVPHKAGHPHSGTKTHQVKEVAVCMTDSYQLTGYPGEKPIKRADSANVDPIRSRWAANFLLNCDEYNKESLTKYLDDHMPAQAPFAATYEERLAAAIKSGRIAVRRRVMQCMRMSDLGVAVSDLTITGSGKYFIFNWEALRAWNIAQRLHWPGGASGVTLGPGYDMGSRAPAAITNDLVEVGIDGRVAQSVSEAARRTGEIAHTFVREHRNLIAIDENTAWGLFYKVLPTYVDRTAAQIPAEMKSRLFEYEFDMLVSYVYNAWTLKSDLKHDLHKGDLRHPSFGRSGPRPDRINAERITFTTGDYQF